jgi:hypothetical protein
VVKTFRILDRFVRFIHTIILSMAALIGLFIMPPIGILLLLYLRSFMQYDATENKSV